MNVICTVVIATSGIGYAQQSERTSSGPGAGQCLLLLRNGLCQERHGGIQRTGNYGNGL